MDTAVHLNRTGDKKMTATALSTARSLTGYSTLRRLMPSAWRSWIKKRYLLRQADTLPRWHPHARRRVVELLREDTAEFLRHYGKPKGFWNLDE
jgi:hypothetical protein